MTKLEYRRDDTATNSISDTSKQYYQKLIRFRFDQWGWHSKDAADCNCYRKAGTPVYRVTVAKEIREALQHCQRSYHDVTLKLSRVRGLLEGTLMIPVNHLTHTGTLTKRDLLPGDIIRRADEYRVIQSHDDPSYKLDSPLTISSASKIFKQNGMKYDITFEQGCRTHEDCRYNGVDENDSDGPAQKVLYEGGDNNAAYCHNGGTCMCTDGFYGPGCTQTGRGHHANAKVTVSGDVYTKCDGSAKKMER